MSDVSGVTPPTPPTLSPLRQKIIKALQDCELVEINGGELATIDEIYTPEGCALVRAQAVANVLNAEGETWWRSGTVDRDFLYSFDSAGLSRVLVIPLEEAPGA